MNDVWLTTVDNPYDPFTHFDEWFTFDLSHNYNCCGFVARIARVSDDLSFEDNETEIEDAIDWIVANDPTGLYVRVEPNDDLFSRD